ncbi:iron-sulfur cluster repair di-iron protein ScdA [Salinicoccus sp. HZC-1]|uniref:iron-sulfur cluster repair di-iron protein ScdA n=1 Tax=Salinicoccus sp. HZC-1 TaxID=3385497 RepID=UPI00398AA04A
MNQELQEKHVATIVTEYPKTADVFRSAGIDFCCGGKMPLKEAVEASKYDGDEIYLAVDEKISSSNGDSGSIDMKYLSIPSIIDYIQNRYHEDLREELVNLTPYITKVSRVHGENHPHLIQVKELFSKLKSALIEHTDDEDRNVFPKIADYAQNHDYVDDDALQEALQKLLDDHDGAGNILKRMRQIADGFQPPQGACGTYRLVYARLENLEKETFDHVHMENHVLFERVNDLMKKQSA